LLGRKESGCWAHVLRKYVFARGISRCARESLFIPELPPPAFFLLRCFVLENRLVAQPQEAAGACSGPVFGSVFGSKFSPKIGRLHRRNASRLFCCRLLFRRRARAAKDRNAQIVASGRR